ncbi:putative DNA internalization-related competence protein ComEC/Rec2 with Metallo-beta-lactamase superfamily domain [Pseudoalteromonas luteoviolacea B = ATCC 29581]|nr:putative DNA internalization-related competence protein ComEC/Rec2 with Metallo-beta-lactamase superfamily domain [Pseudoalteromonas luteoviolacea B = ATCC 29581]
MNRFFRHSVQPSTSVLICCGFLCASTSTLFLWGSWYFLTISVLTVLVGVYFKPIYALLLGFIAGFFYVYFVVSTHLGENRIIAQIKTYASIEIKTIISNEPNFYTLVRLCETDKSCIKGYLAFPKRLIDLQVGDRFNAIVKLKPFRTNMHFYGRNSELFAYINQVQFKGRLVEVVARLPSENALSQQVKARWWDKVSSLQFGGIYYALLFGDKRGITEKQKQQFQYLGISHLLAISGMHVGIFYLLSFWTCRFLAFPFCWRTTQGGDWNRQYALAGILLSALYVWLSGMSVSSQRAFIMLSLGVWAYFNARPYLSWSVLGYSIVLVTVINPFSWLDVGFYLSYLALIAVFLGLKISTYLEIKSAILKLFIIQLSCFCVLLPVSVYLFHGVSIAGLWFNMLAIPYLTFVLFPLILMDVLCTIAIDSLVFLPLHEPWLSWGFTKLAALPKSLVWLPLNGLKWIEVIFLYVMFMFILFLGFKRFALLLFVFLISQRMNHQAPLLRLVVFDVGHGTMVLAIRNKQAFLYDFGPSYFGRYNYIGSTLARFIEKENIKISHAVASHEDNDHVGGRDAFLNSSHSHHIANKDGVYKECQITGDELGEGIEIVKHWPKGSVDGLNDNNRSCVLTIKVGQFSILLPGDIEATIERTLASMAKIKSDILLVPHHGSKSSSTEPFITAVSPKYGVISRSFYNPWNIPHPEVKNRYTSYGTELFDTALQGDIDIRIYANEIEVKTAREQRHWWFLDN